MKISAVIPAAGSGSRYSKTKSKLLEEINGIPVIVHTLRAVSSIDEISEIIICTSDELIIPVSKLVEKYEIPKIETVVLGGQTRQESVFIGLKECDNPDFVLIHDGARPVVSSDIIKNSIKTAVEKGASIAAVPAKDTIKRVDETTGEILETLNRQELWNVQTPQIFKYRNILQAHEAHTEENFTDDAALMEKAGHKVFVSMGSYKNIKITTEEDLQIAKMFLK